MAKSNVKIIKDEPKTVIIEEDPEMIEAVETNLNEIENEGIDNDSDDEDYDTLTQKEEAEFIKKNNIKKQNLFEEED